ncbi:hypothetical protein [Pseudonocardia lacus]|uniref:hypothetical protein n=1 Tax=Pseudonocardia lacus TaxID=2835865 RepID=UPI001BDD20BC|nr:hypothetical protein [Pseudonocardia lacus]
MSRTSGPAVVLAVLAVAALPVACAGGDPAAPAPAPAPTTSPAPDPVVACAGQLVYWAGQDLAGVPGEAYDYQHRGLTSEQNDALRVLEEQARAQGWGPDRIAAQAHAACEPIVAANPQGF